MSIYTMLFTPLRIGEMEVKNRIGMAPMTSGYAGEDGYVTQTLIDFYMKRARNGVGLITVESCYVDRGGRGFPGHLSIENDGYVPELTRMTEAVKGTGTRIVLQLIHCGRQTTSTLCGRQPVAPSPIPCPVIREMPRELSTEEIEGIVQKFADAAGRAKEAGFDGVEIHGAHGYLLNQFLSPYSNKRSDRYGGDLFNRSKVILEILTKTKEKTGRDFPVLCRLSADEFVSGGLTLSDTRQVAVWLQNAGLDALSVTGGVYETAYRIIPPMDVEQGSLVHLAQGIKEAVRIPVFTVGGIHDPSFADQILVQGKADMVLLGRTLLADPEWPAKVQRGREGTIRPCIYCNHCRNRAIRPKINCAVNYETGREAELASMSKAPSPRNVVIVGGGIAGLQAAYTCAQNGHKVTLYEKTGELGGNLLLASLPPKRQRLKKILSFLSEGIGRLDVRVYLKTEPSLESILKSKPDVLFLATGAKPILPNIPGIDGPNVCLAVDVLRGLVNVGRSVAIIGGGLVGLETADHLRAQGKAVTIIEKLPAVGADGLVEANFQKYLLDRLTGTDQSVLILTSTEVKEIGADYVQVIQETGEKRLTGIDTVVVAAGSTPHLPVDTDQLPPACEVFIVGDAVTPRTLFEAVHSASEKAYTV